MHTLLAVVVGGLYATGIYLLLRRNIVKLVLGFALLSYAANLLIFVAGGLGRARPPLLRAGAGEAEAIADPLPQALILTAIVIGFGVLAFSLVLAKRAYQAAGTDDLDEMRTTDA